MSDEPVHLPTWVRALLALELLGWLGLVLWGLLLAFIISGFGSPDLLVILAVMAGAGALSAFCALLVFIALLSRSPRPAPARLGLLHNALGVVSITPVVLMLFGFEIAAGGTSSPLVLVATGALPLLPFVGWVASRVPVKALGWIGCLIGLVSAPLGAFVLFAILSSSAVSGGLTV